MSVYALLPNGKEFWKMIQDPWKNPDRLQTHGRQGLLMYYTHAKFGDDTSRADLHTGAAGVSNNHAYLSPKAVYGRGGNLYNVRVAINTKCRPDSELNKKLDLMTQTTACIDVSDFLCP